jgi:hypothetical protein
VVWSPSDIRRYTLLIPSHFIDSTAAVACHNGYEDVAISIQVGVDHTCFDNTLGLPCSREPFSDSERFFTVHGSRATAGLRLPHRTITAICEPSEHDPVIKTKNNIEVTITVDVCDMRAQGREIIDANFTEKRVTFSDDVDFMLEPFGRGALVGVFKPRNS